MEAVKGLRRAPTQGGHKSGRDGTERRGSREPQPREGTNPGGMISWEWGSREPHISEGGRGREGDAALKSKTKVALAS